MKKGSSSSVYIQGFAGATSWGRATFNLETGTITSVDAGTAKIENVGNGVYRCSVIGTPSTLINFTFTAPTTTGDCYIWGAQLEAGAFPTSYIKTEASQVTRSADSASMTGANFSDWFNNSQGTMFADFRFNGLISFPEIFSIGSSSTNFMSISKNSGNFLRGEIVTNGSTVVNTPISVITTANTNYKMSMAYAVNSVAVTAHGVTQVDADCTIPVATTAAIGNRVLSTTSNINGTIKKLSYYPQRLTNTQLQALTS